jgi:NTE family protein
MSIEINGATKRLGLALSGGGFRAAAFHLGVFRKLEEHQLLFKLDLLSCVSGGSIAGAFLASRWNQPTVLDELDHYLRTRSIAVSSVIGGLLDPFASRLDKLAEAYDDHLFGKQSLDSLAGGPRLYLNTTNMVTGNMFSFVTGGGKPTEMGDHELGFRPAAQIRISNAVAASSSFPPVFPPFRLDQRDYPAAECEFVTLSDGGVYDNLGVNPLLRDRNDLDYLLVSDGGKPFSLDERPAEAGTAVLAGSIDILMEQVRGLQFERLRLWSKVEGANPIWFSIDSQVGEQQPGDAAFASSIGTNLKKLSNAEMTVLTRHGGSLLEARLRARAPELL